MSTAIISSREDGKQAATCKPLEAVHDTLMSSQDEAAFVVFQECSDSIRAKLHNVACPVRISNKVGLDSKFGIAVSGVAP